MSSVSDEIAKLFELHKAGAITRDQFEVQRDQLLAESRPRNPNTPNDPTMATEVGAYRLLGLIGEGGMGAVYRGRHRSETMAARQGGDVAVKVMHPQFAKNTEYRDRFEREASLGLRLDHARIVKVHDLVVDSGNLALVMDLVEGRPLSDLTGEAEGSIPWDRAWPMFQKLLVAVGHAHDQEIVHRDIKPDNILVTADGEPHVIDFGIAKDLDASGTRTGTGMGTVEYMAPEQYTDAKAVDRRADIYSLGMILYEMLAGRLPWDTDSPQFKILEQKARKKLMSPAAYCASIPPEIVAALAPALAAVPGERPSTTAAFAEALTDAATRATERWTEEERKTREVAEQQAAVEAERQRVERERQRREAVAALRQKVEQDRQSEEGIVQISQTAAEPGVQRATPVLRTAEESLGNVNGMPQTGRRLRLMGGGAVALVIAVSLLLTLQIVRCLSPEPATPSLPPADEEDRSRVDTAHQEQPEEEQLERNLAEEVIRTAEAESILPTLNPDEERRLTRQLAEAESRRTEAGAVTESSEADERLTRELAEEMGRQEEAAARAEPEAKSSNAEFKASSLAASRLRQWRLGLGLSESQAGTVLGMSGSSMARIEHGQTLPTDQQKLRIESTAGIPCGWWGVHAQSGPAVDGGESKPREELQEPFDSKKSGATPHRALGGESKGRRSLASWRADHGLSFEDFGEILGLSGETTRQIEEGAVGPAPEEALQIEKRIGIPAGWWKVD